MQDIIQMEPELQQSLEQLVNNWKAKGTMTNYNTAQAKFQDYCQARDYSPYKITEQAVVHYIAELNREEVGYATLCLVKPAIVLMEEMFMGKATAFTAKWTDYWRGPRGLQQRDGNQ